MTPELIRDETNFLQRTPYVWHHRDAAVPCSAPLRRLEDRIRELCAKIVAADDDEVATLVSDLQSALREQNNRLRKLAAAKLAGPHPSCRKPSP